MELTRIFTVELTGIAKVTEEDIVPKEEAKAKIEEMISECLCSDNVTVIKIQDFIMEKGDADEQSAATNEES